MKHHDLPLNWLVGLLLVATLVLACAARAQDRAQKASGASAKAATPASGSSAMIRENVRKLSTIILPELEFRETTAREALASLEKMSAEFDPAKVGVKIKIDAGPAKAVAANAAAKVPADPFEIPITVKLNNIPLGEALRYVTSLAGLNFKVEDFGILVGPLVPPQLVTKEWKITPSILRAIGYQTGGDLKEILQVLGVNFPEGAKAALNANQDRLIVTNTAENLTRINFWVVPDAAPPTRDPVASTSPDDKQRRKFEETRRIFEKKLASIIIPRIEFREATIREALDYLKKKSVELDPKHQGTSIVLRLDSAPPPAGVLLEGAPIPGIPASQVVPEGVPPGAVSPVEAKITLSLRNVSLGEALTAVAGLAGLEYKVEDYGISIQPLAIGLAALSIREWNLRPGTLAKLGLAAGADPKAFLTARGIAFPPGAIVAVHPSRRLLIMKNTRANFDLFDNLLDPQEAPPVAASPVRR